MAELAPNTDSTADPADRAAVEVYTDERAAAFLLNNATTADEWAEARRVVRDELGLDPDGVANVIDRPDWRAMLDTDADAGDADAGAV